MDCKGRAGLRRPWDIEFPVPQHMFEMSTEVETMGQHHGHIRDLKEEQILREVAECAVKHIWFKMDI